MERSIELFWGKRCPFYCFSNRCDVLSFLLHQRTLLAIARKKRQKEKKQFDFRAQTRISKKKKGCQSWSQFINKPRVKTERWNSNDLYICYISLMHFALIWLVIICIWYVSLVVLSFLYCFVFALKLVFALKMCNHYWRCK